MGTKMAPSYANIFMGRLEQQLLKSVDLKPDLWLRFIDDIDMHWAHSLTELQKFLETANTFHKSIRFTSEVSNDEHVFLDTVSSITDGKLIVDLYTKPSDKHRYLMPSSCHPKHCCKNIPYSLALRIRRICTQASTYDHRAEELQQHLISRGYDQEAVAKCIQNAKEHERTDLLNYKEKTKQKNRVPFVTTYHPDLPNINKVINKHWPTIDSSRRLSRIFSERPVLAYRRPKCLRDILVKAKITSKNEHSKIGLSSPCKASICQTCKVMLPTSVFNSISGARSSIKGIFNCKTSNAIYLMTCTVCKKQYVGETGQPISLRMNLHRSDWKKRRFNRSPVAEHFSSAQHSFGNMSLCVIESDQRWSDKKRKRRETYWIRRLNTLQPYGINKGD